MAVTANLFIDETGDFSPRGDDMRIVGGLLVIADHSVATDLKQIHDDLQKTLHWPVRLHARELVEPGCVLRWHAAAERSHKALLEGNEEAALDAALVAHPQAAPQHGPLTWSKIQVIPRSSPHFLLLQQVGRKLLRRSQKLLRQAFQQWCGPSKRAFIILGHVDERVPGGAQAYDTAFDQALRLTSKTMAREGAGLVHVELAEPGVQAPSVIAARATRVPRIGTVSVVKYDQGSHGLWIADSLLAWSRPFNTTVPGSALDPSVGVRTCLRAGTSQQVNKPDVLECAFDYFADAVIETDGLL